MTKHVVNNAPNTRYAPDYIRSLLTSRWRDELHIGWSDHCLGPGWLIMECLQLLTCSSDKEINSMIRGCFHLSTQYLQRYKHAVVPLVYGDNWSDQSYWGQTNDTWLGYEYSDCVPSIVHNFRPLHISGITRPRPAQALQTILSYPQHWRPLKSHELQQLELVYK